MMMVCLTEAVAGVAASTVISRRVRPCESRYSVVCVVREIWLPSDKRVLVREHDLGSQRNARDRLAFARLTMTMHSHHVLLDPVEVEADPGSWAAAARATIIANESYGQKT